MRYKGIILAGGSGTRLYPLTKAVSKQLLPVYDKPMIYYPLSVLMLAGIRDILVITKPEEVQLFENLIGDGSQWGVNIRFAVQEKPAGIAQGLIIAEEFLDNCPSLFILGDNIFYGSKLPQTIRNQMSINKGGGIFSYHVKDPQRYGVVELSDSGNILKIIEKPEVPPSNMAVTGLYILDETAPEKARSLTPSARGELEITDLLNLYLADNSLSHTTFDRGTAWLDTGTTESLLDASLFVQTIEKRQGYKIACLEEIAFTNSWISLQQLQEIADTISTSDLGRYLQDLLKQWNV